MRLLQLADGSVLSGESLSRKFGIVGSIHPDPEDWGELIGNSLEHPPKLVEDKVLFDVLSSWLSTTKPASRGGLESGAAVLNARQTLFRIDRLANSENAMNGRVDIETITRISAIPKAVDVK